jgi:hypothetical protein
VQAAILEDSEWPADAVATIVGLSHAQEFFTADDLARDLRKPPHPNHVGAAFLAAKNQGLIEPVSYTTSNNSTRKHGALRTWRRKTQRGEAAA